MSLVQLPATIPPAPLAHRVSQLHASFDTLLAAWLSDAQKRGLRERPIDEVERTLTRDVPEWFREMAITSITRRDVAAVLSLLEDRPGIKRGVHGGIRRVLRWAHERGVLDTDPTSGLRVRPPRPRERVLSEHELRLIWHSVGNMGDFGSLVRLLMLTGQRRQELGSMQWSEIEFTPTSATYVLPASRSKNHKPHALPIVARAAVLLRAPRPGFPHVFGNSPGAGFNGWGKGVALLTPRLIGMPHWTLHDIRRTVATQMAERDICPPHIVEAILNHVSGHKAGVAGTYNRALYLTQKREALERWSDVLAQIVEG